MTKAKMNQKSYFHIQIRFEPFTVYIIQVKRMNVLKGKMHAMLLSRIILYAKSFLLASLFMGLAN